MFYTLRPHRGSASRPAWAAQGRRLGVSLHAGLHRSRFCHNVGALLRKHDPGDRVRPRLLGEVALFEQGVLREYVVGDAERPMAERLEAASKILARFPDGHRVQPADLVDHLVSVRSAGSGSRRPRGLDAMIGFRFHGNMVALTQGVPCFYYVYDSRITEFCRLYRLPHLAVEDPWVGPGRRDPRARLGRDDRRDRRLLPRAPGVLRGERVAHTLGPGGMTRGPASDRVASSVVATTRPLP